MATKKAAKKSVEENSGEEVEFDTEVQSFGWQGRRD